MMPSNAMRMKVKGQFQNHPTKECLISLVASLDASEGDDNESACLPERMFPRNG